MAGPGASHGEGCRKRAFMFRPTSNSELSDKMSAGVGREMISALEAVGLGDGFDHLFMEMMSRHHYTATLRSTECLVSSEIMHDDLHRYCRGIWHSQVSDIQTMRKLLCRKFGICDYQPLEDPRGRHSGGPERATIGFGR